MLGNWILLADEDVVLLHDLENSIAKPGEDFPIACVSTSEDALGIIEKHHFGLVVMDYYFACLPDTQVLKKIHVKQPDCKIVLMTTPETTLTEAEMHEFHVDGCLEKPIQQAIFQHTLRAAINPESEAMDGLLVIPQVHSQEINRILQELHNEVGARCILLTDIDGREIACNGLMDKLPVRKITALLSKGQGGLIEVGRTLDQDADSIQFMYRESKSTILFAIDIGWQYLLTILIDRGSTVSFPGHVWYSARIAAEAVRKEFRKAGILQEMTSLKGQSVPAISGHLAGTGKEVTGISSTGAGIANEANKVQHPEPSDPACSLSLSYSEAMKNGIISDQTCENGFPVTIELE